MSRASQTQFPNPGKNRKSISGGIGKIRSMFEPANRRSGTAVAKHLWLMTFLILTLAVPATGQDRKKPAPHPAEGGGSEAVFCEWVIIIHLQALTEGCGWARLPVDDAVDEASTAVEDFIVANYSNPPTRSMVEDVRRHFVATIRANSTRAQFCETAAQSFPGDMRSRASPYQVREWTKKIVSTPRKQLSGACL